MIDNPLEINDWAIKKFLAVVIGIQVSVLLITGLAASGFDIPVLRQIVGFFYLAFIPGVIILRILRLHRMGPVETLLYSVGLSLAFDMFLGFIVNALYPQVGLSMPITTLPLVVTWTVVLGLLMFVAYIRDRSFSSPSDFNLRELLASSVLFLLLLPLLAILGVQVVNSYANNLLLLILIALIAFIALIIILSNLIDVRYYPLAVFSIALALLWHSSLLSRYLTGYDIFSEYYYFSAVFQSGFWNSETPQIYNAMLSITVLPAIFSQLLHMGGEQVFKVIYPVFYALVPLALYEVYGKQFKSKQAFAAAFLFMSIWVFYLSMPSVARQMIGELFYALLLLLIIKKEDTAGTKTLFIVFGAGLVISHYSLSYLFMGFLVLSLVILHLLKEKRFHVTSSSSALFITICLAWYMYISSSAPLEKLTRLGNNIYDSLSVELLNPFSRDISTVFLGAAPNALVLGHRILYYLMLFFMVIGALSLISGLRKKQYSREYLSLATGNYILLAACIAIPFFSETLGSQRMFHLAAIVLAPFGILGAEAVFDVFSRLSHSTSHPLCRLDAKMAVAPLLVLFLLFDSGFIFEVTRNPRLNSAPLSLTAIEDSERFVYPENKASLRNKCPTEQEVISARWLAIHRDKRLIVSATYLDARVPALVAYGLIPEEETVPILPPSSNSDIRSGYIYLGYVNVVFGYGVTHGSFLPQNIYELLIWEISQISFVLDKSEKLYANGASEVYWKP